MVGITACTNFKKIIKYKWTSNLRPPSSTVWIIFFITSACLKVIRDKNSNTFVKPSNLKHARQCNIPARMNWGHRTARNMWVRFHSNCFLCMILTNIGIHFFYCQWQMILIITTQPQSRGLVIFIVSNVQIISSCWNYLIISIIAVRLAMISHINCTLLKRLKRE